MGESKGRQLASKWTKTAALLEHPEIAPHIPPTMKLNKDNLKSMLKEHGIVVIKPIVGAGGHGVIKVTKTEDGYSYTYYSKLKIYPSFDELFESLNRKRKGRAYLIQKGIELATVKGRPIDYRVKYVKEGERWEIRAIVGRIAKKGLFVTNLCRGGKLVNGSEGISMSLSPKEVKPKKREMRKLTVLATKLLEKKYPGIGQLGFDYGIDKEKKIWIFEVNTRPQ